MFRALKWRSTGGSARLIDLKIVSHPTPFVPGGTPQRVQLQNLSTHSQLQNAIPILVRMCLPSMRLSEPFPAQRSGQPPLPRRRYKDVPKTHSLWIDPLAGSGDNLLRHLSNTTIAATIYSFVFSANFFLASHQVRNALNNRPKKNALTFLYVLWKLSAEG